MSSVIGSVVGKWIIGLIAVREDGEYYLEDSSHHTLIRFSELQYADPEAFFAESMVVLCCGIYKNDCFYITHIKHPPLHAHKSFVFRLNETDYFGAYTK